MAALAPAFPSFSPVAAGRPPAPFLPPPAAPSRATTLGKYAESSSPITNQSLSVEAATGEILREGYSYEAVLIERYALQSQARRAMLERWRRDGGEGKAHKLTRCRRWLRPRPANALGPVAPYAEILKHGETGRTFFGGTEICGSPGCAVCAAKIQERRANEIRAAVDQWAAEGGICLFVTLTVPHGVDDELAPMLRRFRSVLERFRGGKRFAAVNKGLGRVGLIRAFECTWGSMNGWHPHTHELWFVRPDELRAWVAGWLARDPLVDPSLAGADSVCWRTACQYALQSELVELWRVAAVSAGLPEPSSAHGLDLRIAETQEELRARLADYLTKLGKDFSEDGRPLWGVAEEMVRAHSKKGREGRRMSPYDFLRAQFDPEISVGRKIRYRELFADYVQAFKGVAMVFWSHGLKGRFDLDELTDSEVAEESREAADVLARLEPEQWAKLFVRADHRASLLILAQEGGLEAVRFFLAGLPSPARVPDDTS